MTADAGPVEYAVSADGVRVAYQRVGHGPLTLRLPGFALPLRVWEDLVSVAGLSRKLRRSASIVGFDARGTGMSDRNVLDFSLDACVADAAAVAEALGPPVPVVAELYAGPVALSLAARRPDLVSHLVLTATGAHGAELVRTPVARATRALLELDWGLFKDYMARVMLRLDREHVDAYCSGLDGEVDARLLLAWLDEIEDHDASDCLDDVEAAVLILEWGRVRADTDTASMGRDLARRLRNGRLSRPRTGDEANSEIVEFLFGDEDEVIRGAFRVIMFTDLVASTAITQRVGDDAAQRVVDAHDAAVAEALSAHHGVQIKHTGDGAMAAFDSATNALRAAHELANRFKAIGVNARVGLNAGEPIERNGDLFGTAVQLAARVCDAASKGEVLATQAVRDIAAGKQLRWSPPRELHLKGFDQPVKVSSLVLD